MVTVVGSSRLRRADRILDAITKELNKRRSSLNNDPDVRSVTIVIKMKTGSEIPRTAIMHVETESEIAVDKS